MMKMEDEVNGIKEKKQKYKKMLLMLMMHQSFLKRYKGDENERLSE